MKFGLDMFDDEVVRHRGDEQVGFMQGHHIDRWLGGGSEVRGSCVPHRGAVRKIVVFPARAGKEVGVVAKVRFEQGFVVALLALL